MTWVVDAKASANDGEVSDDNNDGACVTGAGAKWVEVVGFSLTSVVDAKASANGDEDEDEDDSAAVVVVVVAVVAADKASDDVDTVTVGFSLTSVVDAKASANGDEDEDKDDSAAVVVVVVDVAADKASDDVDTITVRFGCFGRVNDGEEGFRGENSLLCRNLRVGDDVISDCADSASVKTSRRR